MKTKNTILSIFLAFVFLQSTFAQSTKHIPTGGEFIINSINEPCLTEGERDIIKLKLTDNISQLEAEGKLISTNKRGTHILLDWPVEKAAGVDYESVWIISNYIDQNPNYPNQLLDYDCGEKTYDTNTGYNHKGIDVRTWPFTWYQMDHDQSIIVAGADGQIIGKSDGNFDRNCSFNNDPWNSVSMMHTDGSVVWYGHMKNGSLTSKNVGEFVEQGEYLGVIGSSGNSTSAHLHMEIYEDDTFNQLIDPFFGPCNSTNPDSWWLDQKPYLNPYINALLTHSAPPEFPACPTTEIPNISNSFNLGDNVFFSIYFRDQEAGTNVNLKLIKPDNTPLYDWNYDLTDYYRFSYWTWQFPLNIEGTWKWQATYNGQTVVHPFDVGTLGVENSSMAQTSVYPNPIQTKLFIETEANIVSVEIRDLLGRSVFGINMATKSISEIDVSFLTKGIYVITLTSDENQSKTLKLIKE